MFAEFTLEWLLTSVYSRVLDQGFFGCETLVTDFALESRRFARFVCVSMSRQRTLLYEAFVAYLTFERLLSNVPSYALCYAGAICKALVADVARERFLAGVCSRVSPQSACRGEAFVADLAFVWPFASVPTSMDA